MPQPEMVSTIPEVDCAALDTPGASGGARLEPASSADGASVNVTEAGGGGREVMGERAQVARTASRTGDRDRASLGADRMARRRMAGEEDGLCAARFSKATSERDPKEERSDQIEDRGIRCVTDRS